MRRYGFRQGEAADRPSSSHDAYADMPRPFKPLLPLPGTRAKTAGSNQRLSWLLLQFFSSKYMNTHHMLA